MVKYLIRICVLSLILLIFFVFFISYFGVETSRFNQIIKERSNVIHKDIKLNFKKTKLLLDLNKFSLFVELTNPKIFIKNRSIDLEKLNLFLPVKSFFTKDFILERAELKTTKIKIKNLVKLYNTFSTSTDNILLSKIFKEGNFEGQLILRFEKSGKISKDYFLSGKLSEASLNINSDFLVENLTSRFVLKNKKLDIFIERGFLSDIDLSKSKIKINRDNQQLQFMGELVTSGAIKNKEIQEIFSYFDINLKNIQTLDGSINLLNEFEFNLDKFYRIKNLNFKSKGKIPFFYIKTKKIQNIKQFMPTYANLISLKNNEVEFIFDKSILNLKLNGDCKLGENYEKYKFNQKYDLKKDFFNIAGTAHLKSSSFKIQELNYIKKLNNDATLNFDIDFSFNKYFKINKILYEEGKSKINLKNFKLNKNFKIVNFDSLKVITFSNNKKNNDFLISKHKEINVSGNLFDAKPILEKIYKERKTKILSKNIKSKIKVKISEILTGTNDDIINFDMIAELRDGSYQNMIARGHFSNDEVLEISIHKISPAKKSLRITSDRAKLFVNKLDFVKDFKGGRLDFQSIISKSTTESKLTITDFKVSKVPALAQLLSLASLQGIADTLTGEGLRFTNFDMQYTSKKNVLNISEVYASGPAISILLDGYIEKGKLVSLSGTLVPAKALNKLISKIPVISDILIGKKLGEGVFGVSFKMKGPPKNIKTTVNPVKTLTPRFIVRAVEKMKKKKKGDTK